MSAENSLSLNQVREIVRTGTFDKPKATPIDGRTFDKLKVTILDVRTAEEFKVQRIVNHVAGSSRLVFDGVTTGSGEYLLLLKPLMWDEDLSDVDDSGESRESVDNYDVYQANVSAFVLWIKQMVPMASDIRVKLGSSFSPEISCEDHFSDLVSRLYQLGNRVKYSCESRKGVPVELGLDEIRDLVHISLKDKYSSGRFTHLARQNAQTLQSLYLESPRFYNLVNLIQNPGGSYVTYPCLHTLILRDHLMYDISRRSAFPGTVPFPSLRSLTLRLQYPFGDDTMFRGNSATLEGLTLTADSFFVAMVRQYGVFTPTSHPQLRCIKWEGWRELVPAAFATYAEGIRFALSIGPGASVRKIGGVLSCDQVFPALSLPGGHSSIQVLSIKSTKLDIWQAISLVKSLPLLSDLTAPFPRIGAMPYGVTRAELPKYMTSTYSPMGERFRCWHLQYCTDEDQTGDVEWMLLLALICPNFDYVATGQERRESFMEDLEWYIDLERFSSYAPRLRRLLFNGWQNC
ncbi:hypothetical protein GGI14_003352 [Coemansia sp. S680]|nr:hypothetical protein GGI14_003352 [Coemansia sp. S680]